MRVSWTLWVGCNCNPRCPVRKTGKTALCAGGNLSDVVTISFGTHSSLFFFFIGIKFLGLRLSFQDCSPCMWAGNGRSVDWGHRAHLPDAVFSPLSWGGGRCTSPQERKPRAELKQWFRKHRCPLLSKFKTMGPSWEVLGWDGREAILGPGWKGVLGSVELQEGRSLASHLWVTLLQPCDLEWLGASYQCFPNAGNHAHVMGWLWNQK